MTSEVIAEGTVKVGRWTYPARASRGRDGFPFVERNTRRDGTGSWVIVKTETQDTFEAKA